MEGIPEEMTLNPKGESGIFRDLLKDMKGGLNPVYLEFRE